MQLPSLYQGCLCWLHIANAFLSFAESYILTLWHVYLWLIKNPLVELKEDAILEGYRCKEEKCHGFLFYKAGKLSIILDAIMVPIISPFKNKMIFYAENKAFTCQVCGLSRDEYHINQIANEVEELSAKAATFLSTGSILYKISYCMISLWNSLVRD